MDRTDIRITELLENNARMSYQELGERLGMSRTAAKKRVQKLEKEGIIQGYHACIRRDEEIVMLIDLVTAPGKLEDVQSYVSSGSAEVRAVRQIFRTTKENHLHMVAVSDSVQTLSQLTRMIRNTCGSDIIELDCHAVKEMVKGTRDENGGIRYDDRTASDTEGDYEPSGGGGTQGQAREEILLSTPSDKADEGNSAGST